MAEITLKEKYEKILTSRLDWSKKREKFFRLINEYSRKTPEQTRNCIEKLTILAQEQNDQHFLGVLNYLTSWLNIDSDDYLSGIENLNKALPIFKANNDSKHIILTLSSLGFCHTSLGNTDKAFQYFDQALILANEYGDDSLLGNLYGNMGECYLNLNRYSDALASLEKSLTYEPEFGQNRATILGNMGCVYFELGEYEKALNYHKQTLEIAQAKGIAMVEVQSLGYIGAAYSHLQNPEEAIKSLKRAIKQAHANKLLRIEAELSLQLSKILIDADKAEESLSYLQRALNIHEKIKIIFIKIEALQYISKAYKALGDWQKAYHYYYLYHKEQEIYFNEKTAKEINRLKTKEALREAELFKDMHQQISIVSQIGKEITSSLQLKDIVYSIYNEIGPFMDVSVLGLALYNEENKEIHFPFFIELGKWIEPFSLNLDNEESLSAWCINNRMDIVLNDLNNEYPAYIKKIYSNKIDEKEKINSLIYLLLEVNDKIIGVLSVQSYKKNAYTDYQVELFKALASYVAIAIENARYYETVQRLATKDYLTGLTNRSLFLSLGKDELVKYKKTRKTFSIIMFDLDSFKNINDKYGHAVGDQTLKEVANIFNDDVRNKDYYCRYGGDEFLILLPETHLIDALIFVERIQNNINNLKIELPNEEFCQITASFGLTAASLFDEDFLSIIKRADLALYESKDKGGNAISYRL